MNESEYFSNIYRKIIKNKPFHIIIMFIEYILSIIIEIIIVLNGFNSVESHEKIHNNHNFLFLLIHFTDIISFNVKIFIIILTFILIPIYYFIYSKIQFKASSTLNSIIINLVEIFCFRLLFIYFCHIELSLSSIPLIICIVISIPSLVIIIHDFLTNHLYYFALKIKHFPYDYFTAMNETIHLVQKIFLCSSMKNFDVYLNKFFFIIAIILQIFAFFYSLYIFLYKSYYIMNNIFLNKTRFSFIVSTLASSIILIIYGKKNIFSTIFLLTIFNIFITIFLIVHLFYDPYKYITFKTDEHLENLYYYFFIINHIKNESFLLEENIQNHHSKCQKCNLCKNLKLI